MNSYSGLMKPWHEQLEAVRVTVDCSVSEVSETVETHEAEVINAHSKATLILRQELLGRIHAQSPEFFEHLIIDVMLAMGYGGRRCDFASKVSRRLILIDGLKLAELMVCHNIGVKVRESYQFKRLDGDYFSPASFKQRTTETNSASTHPRR